MSISENIEAEIHKEEPQTRNIRGEVIYVYANNSQVSASHQDIHIAFGENIPGLGVQPRSGVVMSLHHAKAFSEVLSKILNDVEEKIGKVTILRKDTSKLDS